MADNNKRKQSLLMHMRICLFHTSIVDEEKHSLLDCWAYKDMKQNIQGLKPDTYTRTAELVEVLVIET
jgi:hypothetical protein